MSSHDQTDRDLSLLSFDETPPPPPPPPPPAQPTAPAPELTGRLEEQLCRDIIQLGKPPEVDTGRSHRPETPSKTACAAFLFHSVDRTEGVSWLGRKC